MCLWCMCLWKAEEDILLPCPSPETGPQSQTDWQLERPSSPPLAKSSFLCFKPALPRNQEKTKNQKETTWVF